MKVLFLSAYDTRGGAGIACLRLAEALYNKGGIEVKVLVNDKSGASEFVESVHKTFLYKIRRFFSFLIEPLIFSFYARTRGKKFAFSCGRFGNAGIAHHPWVKEADVIHIHWINHSFLSLDNIEQLQAMGKLVAWTLHDMWAFTGICHYSGDCMEYVSVCNNCHFLRHPGENDLSHRVWMKKLSAYRNIRFITTSEWLGNLARKSRLLGKFPVTTIPAPINSDLFKPISSKLKIRKKLGLDANKIYILFGADSLSDDRKGLKYLLEAVKLMKEKYPLFANNIELLLFGKKFKPGMLEDIPYKYVGELKSQSEIVRVYNAADLYVTPSLQDNLPNTVMESLSCGIPVVAFKTGGIPEMVEHQTNGYLAKYQSHEDLMNGILWVISDKKRYDLLSKNARAKVTNSYCYELISEEQIEYYRSYLLNSSDTLPLAANF